ncbi:MAG: glycerol-3-phosphate dehydrogenase/oxidase [Anaerolineae bacterium]|nr:MAG: glycerol-3-phosphate dehydrogenase/oxidase [Anaerolineae bacterium]
MLDRERREAFWSQLDREFDLVIIGGGITGAGILAEATRLGLRAALFEAADFASGTSSRSSKLVHGGLRYLRNAQVKLTWESVRERERLLKEGRGLVSPLPFLMANFRGERLPPWLFGIGLTIYDLMALKWNHAARTAQELRSLCPPLTSPDLVGGYRYFDARVDDARLVLRLVLEAIAREGVALNYARVVRLLTRRDGRVCGVAVRDENPSGQGRTREVRARVVVNATGAWADEVRAQVGGRRRLRRLRGGHLVFPFERLPLTRAVTFLHPRDARPVFAVPWEGVTFFGTTDVDHREPLRSDVRISEAEAEYLLEALRFAFPDLSLSKRDVLSTYAGVRAVVDTGKADPSKESREFVLWREAGLLTVSGGKLTTFRLMAHHALRAVRAALPEHEVPRRSERIFDPLPAEATLSDLPPEHRLRLLGRYGRWAARLVEIASPDELEPIAPLPALWAELRWAAHAEAVLHLDDLLLRRVRLGLTLPQGGLEHIERIRALVQGELGWDDDRWEQEVRDYRERWQRFYSPV